MPKREDEFWAAKNEPKRKGCCPKCGNANISYNENFHTWRCNGCEHSFPVPSYGLAGVPKLKIPWDEKRFEVRIKEKRKKDIKGPKVPLPTIEEAHENTDEDYLVKEDNINPKSKAWFGNEYYDKKTRKWKKPGNKKSSILISLIALLVVIAIVVIVILYVFVFAEPVS